MLVTVLIYNVLKDFGTNEEKIKIDVHDSTTIQDLLNSTEYEIADLSDYYHLSRPFAWSEAVLPYLFSNGHVLYDVLYTEATVSDFIKTHGIHNNTLRIVVGYPQAGGPGFLDLVQLWDNVYPVLEQVVTIAGVAQIVGGAVKWICNFFKKRKLKPQPIFDIVFSRKQWNSSELSEMLELPHDRAKDLLTLCAYQYDKRKMMYIVTEQSSEIRDKLANVKVFDIE